MATGGGDLASCMLEFCLNIFKQVVRENPNDNAFLSPSSIIMVMSMVQLGSEGNTRSQKTEVLRFENFKQTNRHASLGRFMSALKKEDKNIVLKTVTKLFPHQDKTILKEYVTSVAKQYQTEVKAVDFTKQPEEARLEINQWVETETSGKIMDLLAQGTINSLAAMVVVNVIYFKGNWATQFDKQDTVSDIFHTIDSKIVTVEMMKRKMENVGYSRNDTLSCSVLELPYQGDELSMIIVLPNGNQDLQRLEANLTVQTFGNLLTSLHKSTVDVSLPKFKIESSYKLKKVLSSLGMPYLFDEDNADLSGMSKVPLYVSHVVHKAFVDVNKEGTEAAAATGAVVAMEMCIEITPNFRADHPFLFVIFDKRHQVPLFIGRVVSPATNMQSKQSEEL